MSTGALEQQPKFIARNRHLRSDRYDVETYGAQKKINLPFIVGVMSDLAKSQSEEAQRCWPTASSLEIDIDNFDRRMSALKPRLGIRVENTLTGEGLMDVNIDFESMDDFSPARSQPRSAP